MEEALIRLGALLGEAALGRLSRARVAVFGVGGVGGYAAEALARCGVGAIDLIDGDTIAESNLNRQIVALRSTLGMPKAEAMAARIRDIRPETAVAAHRLFYLPETAGEIDLGAFDFVIDAVDTVAAKLEIAERADALGVPHICALGAGNKLDPTRLQVCDLYETSVCPLARVMRREARRRGIERLRVVYSTEPPVSPPGDAARLVSAAQGGATRRAIPASAVFVPAAMGLLLAREAVLTLAEQSGE